MWVLLQFISGSIQKNALADFLPVMKLFDLLYPEKEVHICPGVSGIPPACFCTDDLLNGWHSSPSSRIALSCSVFQFRTLPSPSRRILSPWPASGSTWIGKPRTTTPSCRYPSPTPWNSIMSNLKKSTHFLSIWRCSRDDQTPFLLDSSSSRCGTRRWACLTIRSPCCATPTAPTRSASPSQWGRWWRPSTGTEPWGSTSPAPTAWPQPLSPRCRWTCWIHSQCTQRWGSFGKASAQHSGKYSAVSASHWFPPVLSVWSTVLLRGW